jgi:hypothetical protein
MARYLLLVIGLCILSLVGVILLSPSPEEKLERALSRLSPAEAMAELDRMFASGNRTASLMLRRAELLMAAGSVGAARETLEALAAVPETALVAEERLAELELDLGDVRAAIPHLARALATEWTAERLDRLARLYELVRDEAAELALLADAAPRALQDRSAHRLLELLVARGDMVATEAFLRTRAEVAGASRAEMRGGLVELLAGSGRGDEAVMLAARWFARDRDGATLALANERLLERGAVAEAQVLAREAVRSGIPGAHTVVPVFAGAGHGLTARTLLRDWLDVHREPTREEAVALLAYAEKMQDFDAMRSLLRRGDPNRFDPAFVLGVIKGSYARHGLAALAEFRRYLTPEFLVADPLFAAEIALARQRLEEAARYLEIAAATDLRPWEVEAWAAMARQITAAPVRARLLKARAAGSLAPQP